ncbi:MAG: DUF4440 domain-containing protein [Acidobacteriia bacterium]|nr:DUF4440 domain-containing protein [Terriglobia bacterium]
MTHARRGDAQRLVDSFYSEDACLLPPNRDIVRGAASIVRMWKGVIAGGMKDLTLDTTEFDVHGDMAYGIGRFQMVVEPPGSRRTEQSGKYLVVYKKQPGGAWKAVADMFSPNS